MGCPDCKSEDEGRSPTGDWCNNCGWAYPGLHCYKCGRDEVNKKHSDKNNKPCNGLLSEIKDGG